MHVLKNISERTFEIWKGDRFSEKVIMFCRNNQVHLNLKENQRDKLVQIRNFSNAIRVNNKISPTEM